MNEKNGRNESEMCKSWRESEKYSTKIVTYANSVVHKLGCTFRLIVKH